MMWFQIDKSRTAQPAKGTYKDWKDILRVEGRYQCVYCTISEGRFGGLRNFHVEHYRPKSKYAAHENSIANLFYACAICNSFKGSDWPGDPAKDFSNAAYPDPSACCYSEFLSVDGHGLVGSSVVAGKFIVERLYLNRPQLVNARGLSRTIGAIIKLSEEMNGLIERAPDGLRTQLIDALLATIKLLGKLKDVRPYEPADVQR